MSANEVLVLGDAFFGASHQITAYLEDLARRAGALSAGERYRDNSAPLGNALALGGHGIASQYSAAMAEAAVKVVIMNGGGADLLVATCSQNQCPAFADVATAAEDLLSQMATDGVSDVVYVFYPNPVDPDLTAKMDLLRPLIQSVCESSPVPCHWLDLRPAFANHYSEFIQTDGLNPTAAGAEAAAAEIWATMQAQCIAQ